MNRIQKYQSSISILGAIILCTYPICLPNPKCSASAQNHKKNQFVYKKFIKAQKLINKKRYDEGLKILAQLTPFDPNPYSNSVHSNAARAFFYKKNYKMAIAQGLKALSFNRGDTWVSIYIAKSNLKLGNLNMAKKWFQQYENGAKTSKEAAKRKERVIDELVFYYTDKVEKFLSEGKRVNAKFALEEAIKLPKNKNTAYLHGKLAYVFLRLGSLDGTITQATIANKIDPKNPTYLQYLASANKKKGNFEKSIYWYKAYAARVKNSAERKEIETEIKNLIDDKDKLASPTANNPDYLDELPTLRIWPQSAMPIKVFIPIGEGIKGYRKNYPQIFFDSLQEWRKASGNKISFSLLPNPEGADLEVEWTSAPIAVEQKGRIRTDKGGISVSTTVKSETSKYPLVKKSRIKIITLDYYKQSPLSDDEMKALCLHEIGHSMGIAGHSRNARDIMYYSEIFTIPALTKRDKATMRRLYQDYPPVYSDLDAP